MIENRIESLRFSPVENVTTGTITTLSTHDTSMVFFTGAGAVTIESISYGSKGKVLKLANLTGSTLTLKHNTGSTNKNKIITSNATDLVVANNQITTLLYDHINSRWKIDGATSGGGGTTETTRQFIYTSSPVNSNEYSSFATLHAAALASGLPCEIILKENLTISTGNDWNFTNMVFVGNGSAGSPKIFTIEDSTGTQATFDITAGSATPADYLEHYISLYDDENVLSYIWFDTTGADPEPPGIIAATELKVRVDVSAIASADDVANAIQTTVTGDTYLNSKFTATPTAAVASFVLNFNGVSTLPVSTTANAAVSSFVAGVLGTTVLSTSPLHLRNVSFYFKDYTNQRAWKINNGQSFLSIEARGEGSIGFCQANSTGCTIAPVLITTGAQFPVAMSGYASIWNISNTPFVHVEAGVLQIFPFDSAFGFGSSGNITGSSGAVYILFGRTFPSTSRKSFTLGSFTGTLTTEKNTQLSIYDLNGSPAFTDRNYLLVDRGDETGFDSQSGEQVLGIGASVIAYADSNVNIATLDTTATIDGQFLANPSRVYLGGQTNPVENGVYIVTDVAPAVRDFNVYLGSLYRIAGGTTYQGKWIKNTNTNPFTLDTDPLTHEVVAISKPASVTGTGTQGANLLLSSVFIVEPTGNIVVNMSNPTPGFTYAFTMKQGATPYTIGFTQTIKWKGGTVFTATNSANAIDIVTILYDGTNYYGTFGNGYA